MILVCNTGPVIALAKIDRLESLIGSVGPLVEEARNAGYWLADDLVATARRLAGE